MVIAHARFSVGDIAPREGIPKEEKQRLEAVRHVSWFVRGHIFYANLKTGSYAKFRA